MAAPRRKPVCDRCTDAIEQFSARLDAVEDSSTVLRTQHETMMAAIDALTASQKATHDIITRYKGWVGGALFVISGVFAIVTVAWDRLFR